MGGKETKPQAPQPTIDDVILDMRMTSKRFENESKRCMREKDQLLAKAKQALQKNNDEGAKLYLSSAMNKQKEADNLQKMAHKMDHLQGQIRSNTNQTATMQSLQKITPLLTQQVNSMPIEQLYANLNQFDAAMDAIAVEAKVMNSAFNSNQDFGQDVAVDQMMNQLKSEMKNEISNQMAADNQMMFNQLNQPNMNQQPNQQQLNHNYK